MKEGLNKTTENGGLGTPIEKETDDMQDIITMFDDGNVENLSNVLEIITDAWNYFPHKILDGLSPTEKIPQ